MDYNMSINSFLNYPMAWKPERGRLSRPIYKSLADALEDDIASGKLSPGTKLPPQRELADYLDINFTTVTRAYKLCELKGLIYAVTGSGTFVSPSAAKPITISSAPEKESVIDLGFVSSFECTNGLVAEALRATAERGSVQELLDYSSPQGLPHQRRAAVKWLSRIGHTTDEDHLAIVSGTQNGLALSLLSLFEPGDRIAVDTFTYSNFLELLMLLRLQPVPVAGDEEGMSAEALETAHRLTPLKGVFLMPSCSNPTTAVISEGRKRDLAAVIRKCGLILIEDDMHSFFSEGKTWTLSSLIPESSVFISGTSKPLCSGLRVAFLSFPDRFKERLLEGLFNVNVKTSSLDAEVVTALLLSGMAERILSEKKRLLVEANGLFNSIFPGSPEGHPLSFWRPLPVSDTRPGAELERILLSKGIKVYHSDRFLTGPRPAGCFLRISLSTDPRLEEGLWRLKAELSGSRPPLHA